MDMKGKLQYLAVFALAAGMLLGASSLFLDGDSAEADEATLNMESTEGGNSTEIVEIFVVESGDASDAIEDNLQEDPDDYVVASFDSDGGTAEVDWGTEYQLIAYTYGEDNEVSNDPANLRLGWDGEYWGDDDGDVQMPDEESDDDYQLTEGDSGVEFTGDTFTLDGDDHIAVNYLGNSGGFTLERDETADINEILLQAYF